MEFLRNLPVDHPEELAGLIEIRPGRVVSMALSRSEHCQMTLLAFGDGESVSEERYFGDTLYYVLEGQYAGLSGGQRDGFARRGMYGRPCRRYPCHRRGGPVQASADHCTVKRKPGGDRHGRTD